MATAAGRGRAALAGSVFALVAASLFAMLGPLARFADEAGVGSVPFVAWRAALGAASLVVGVAIGGGLAAGAAALRALDGRGRASLAIATTVGLTLNVSIFVAFDRIPIALALMLFYTYPAMVAAVGVATGREPMTPSRAVALGLATAGVALVLVGLGGPTGDLDPLGIVLGLAAAASQTVFVTVSRTGYRTVPAPIATIVILLGSCIGAIVVSLVLGLGDQLVEPFTTAAPWPAILTAGILAAGLPSFLFLSSIRRIGGVRTGILMLWEPVAGAILAAILLGERLEPIQLVGGALVLSAAVIVQLAAADEARERGTPGREPIDPTIELV